MKRVALASLVLSAFSACAGTVAAQQAKESRAPAGYAPEYAPVMVPATSTPLSGTMTAPGAYGPFVPQLGRAIWIRLTGAWLGEVVLGSTITGSCADAVPLTPRAGVQTTYSGPGLVDPPYVRNSPLGEETQGGVGWCLTAKPDFTGTLNYRLAQ